MILGKGKGKGKGNICMGKLILNLHVNRYNNYYGMCFQSNSKPEWCACRHNVAVYTMTMVLRAAEDWVHTPPSHC